MGHKQQAAELLAKAHRYRILARSLGDRETAGRIWDLSADLERQAELSIRKLYEERVRTRAHQIWHENNCPPGRDVEFWHQAERELEETPEARLVRSRSRARSLSRD